MTTTGVDLLGPDPALPQRDAVLDPDVVAERLLGAAVIGGPSGVEDCRLVRADYRFGESLSALYEVTVDGCPRLLSAWALPDDGAVAEHASTPVPWGTPGLAGRVLDGSLGVLWWTYPTDRALAALAAVARADERVTIAAPVRWRRSDLVSYVPGRSATYRCSDGARTVAYARVHRCGTAPERAARHGLVADWLERVGALTRAPRVLACLAAADLVVVEAAEGRPWSAIDAARRPAAAAQIGRAVAEVHGIPPSIAHRSRPLDEERIARAAKLVALARPDLAPRCAAVAVRLGCESPHRRPDTVLRGRVGLDDALVGDEGVRLLRVDASVAGPPEDDLGSVIAAFRREGIVADVDRGVTEGLEDSFLAGSAGVRGPASDDAVRWATAASLLVEQAVGAIERVDIPSLVRLPDILDAALDLLRPRRSRSIA